MSSSEDYWRRAARALWCKLNLAWWLQFFIPSAAAISLLFSCLLLITRRNGSDSSDLWFYYTVAILLAALGSVLFSKKRFFSVQDSLLRLDVVMSLNNRLSCASDGIGSWPEPHPVSDRASWRWSVILWPLLLSIFLLCGAAWVPITEPESRKVLPSEAPSALQNVETLLKTLEEEQLVAEEVLQHLQEQVRELRSQSPEKWYEHSNLEASDNLEEQVVSSMEALKRNLAQTQSALSDLERDSKEGKSAAVENDREELKKNLEKLEQGSLPLEQKLKQELEEALQRDPKLGETKKLEELSKKLQEADRALEDALKKKQCSTKNGANKDGEKQGKSKEGSQGQGKDGEKQASSKEGSQRQGEDGAKALSKKSSTSAGDANQQQRAREQGKTESGSARKFSEKGSGQGRGPGNPDGNKKDGVAQAYQARPESISALSKEQKNRLSNQIFIIDKGEHPVDRSRPLQLRQGGQRKHSGVDENTVWKQTYTPREREILQRMFD